jgi:hypothetical protein
MLANIVVDGKPFFCVMCWDKYPITKIRKKSGTPKHGSSWSGQKFFLDKLSLLEEFLKEKKLHKKTLSNDCVLCSQKGISHNQYVYKNIVWSESLKHYVDYHNIKPPSKFIRFVLDNDPTIYEKCQKSTVKIKGKIKKLDRFTYVKIKTNQLMILDALMEHGGVTQKYKEKHETGYRYSEHAGVLDFNDHTLEHIIITGSIDREISRDPEIYFPTVGQQAYEYEYIFHTHPATPTIGGRAYDEGILYEYPSRNDLYHFLEHFNNGIVQGSIVITPEGLYNIRKNVFDKQQITVTDEIGKAYVKIMLTVQREAIGKYGFKFDSEFFYSVIAQDMSYMKRINDLLEKFSLHIDFFPRQRNKQGKWVIGTLYLPICLVHKK